MSIDPLRQQALEIIVEVYEGEALDPLLDRALNNLEDRRQAGFLAELVRGTLQWTGRYHHILKCFLKRKPSHDNKELALFHMTLHQLLGLDGVPAYAAIHQAGELCRSYVEERKVGFVNGVLQAVRRRLLPEESLDMAQREALMKPLFENLIDDHVAWLAAWYSHPHWLVQRWVDQYGAGPAEAICDFNNQPVVMAFHVLEPADPVDVATALGQAGLEVIPGLHPRTLLLEDRPGRARLGEIMEQHPCLIVQDPTVQAATRWLLSSSSVLANSPLEDMPVLDMCAAPGGKSVCLAIDWPGSGTIVALDNRPFRIGLLKSTVKRTGQSRIEVVDGDGLDAPFTPGHFGAVLLDGPCSGTGVMRHHPDGRWALSNRKPGRNGRTLRKLAHASLDLLAPGGLLLYATCSLEPLENELVLDKLMAERDDVEICPDEQGTWKRQWLPGDSSEEPGDGFFAARLRKKSV